MKTLPVLPITLALVGWFGSAARAEAEGVDFIKDAKLYYRVVACKGSDPLPATVDPAIVDKHCAEQTKRYDKIGKTYFTPAADFFASVRPAGLPTTIVYPFGGGDLMSALVTYPDAREITTISLKASAMRWRSWSRHCSTIVHHSRRRFGPLCG